MSSKTLINGTVYNIIDGKIQIDGSIYTVYKGKTVIDGSIYNILFNIKGAVAYTSLGMGATNPTATITHIGNGVYNMICGGTRTNNINFNRTEVVIHIPVNSNDIGKTIKFDYECMDGYSWPTMGYSDFLYVNDKNNYIKTKPNTITTYTNTITNIPQNGVVVIRLDFGSIGTELFGVSVSNIYLGNNKIFIEGL